MASKALSDKESRKETIVKAIEKMAEGKSFRKSCLEFGIDSSNALKAIYGDADDLLPHYTRARELYAMAKVDDIDDVINNEPDVQRARLRVDSIKWEASKVLPKLYGDKIQTVHSGDVTVRKVTEMDDSDLLSIAAGGEK